MHTVHMWTNINKHIHINKNKPFSERMAKWFVEGNRQKPQGRKQVCAFGKVLSISDPFTTLVVVKWWPRRQELGHRKVIHWLLQACGGTDANPSVLEITSSEMYISFPGKSQERRPLEQPKGRPGCKTLLELLRERRGQRIRFFPCLRPYCTFPC